MTAACGHQAHDDPGSLFPQAKIPQPLPHHEDNPNQTLYSTLDEDTIRLMRILPTSTAQDIHCSLELQSGYASEHVHYTAISYCWGDLSITESITLNRRIVDVTINLLEALRAIITVHGAIGSGRYWIDALCINQADGTERNHQVHQMWRIFSNADQVLAWVGVEDEYTESAFSAMETLAASCTYRCGLCPGYNKYHTSLQEPGRGMVERLLSRSYFERTWVIQEFAQARSLWLVCGRHVIFGDKLFHFQKFCAGTQAGELLSHRWNHSADARAQSVITSAKDVMTVLANTLFSYSRSVCTDTRDKIFALLGDPTIRRLDSSMRLRPDYGLTVERVAVGFIEYCDTIVKAYAVGTAITQLDLKDMASRSNRFLYSLGLALGVAQRSDFVEAIQSQMKLSDGSSQGFRDDFVAQDYGRGMIYIQIMGKQFQPPPTPQPLRLTFDAVRESDGPAEFRVDEPTTSSAWLDPLPPLTAD